MSGKKFITPEYVRQKLLSSHTIVGDCWIWNRAKSAYKYGMVYLDSKQITVHRAAYLLFVGEIPEGHSICHSCDNTLCINPQHLWAGTPKENTADMIKKNRAAKNRPKFPRGTANKNSKLNENKVLEIRHLYKNGIIKAELSRRFQVDPTVIKRIVNFEMWTHVPQGELI